MGPYLLEDTGFCIFWDSFDGIVAYRLLLSALVNCGVLAMAQDLKQTAERALVRLPLQEKPLICFLMPRAPIILRIDET